MIYTSAEAAKLLKRLQEEMNLKLELEAASRSFVASVGENAEELRPDYDFSAVQQELLQLEVKIRRVKHALNIFNTTTVLEGVGLTIDEALVYLPQLTARKQKLSGMAAALPRTRMNGFNSAIISYTYSNYDAAEAKAAYDAAAAELVKVQTALDLANTTKTMEIDVEF